MLKIEVNGGQNNTIWVLICMTYANLSISTMSSLVDPMTMDN